MPGENEKPPVTPGEINALPPINTAPKGVKALVMDAYRAAVATMEAMKDEHEQWQERKRLFNGYRLGSKVEGVRSQTAVELMFDRIIKEPIPRPYGPRLDHEGNKVYMFDLSQHYHNKGKTVIARLSDIAECGHRDRLQIGVEQDAQGDKHYVLQAPHVQNIPCNIVTIIMSSDDTKFIAWFCGEPRKHVTLETLPLFLNLSTNSLDLGEMQVRLNRDFAAETEQARREKRAAKHVPHPQHKPATKPHQHREPRPLTSVGEALTEAVAEVVKPT
jgi:hypothetical protein